MANAAEKDGKEIMKGIKAGYVIAFHREKKTISFFKNERLHELYIGRGQTEDPLSKDDQLSVGFLKGEDDFIQFVLALADINHLTPRPFKLCSGEPAYIFCKKQEKIARKIEKTVRSRGHKDSVAETI